MQDRPTILELKLSCVLCHQRLRAPQPQSKLRAWSALELKHVQSDSPIWKYLEEHHRLEALIVETT